MNRGVVYGVTAYALWGVLPIYWKALHSVPAIQILANRMVWSLLFCLLILIATRNWSWLSDALRDRRTVLTFVGAAALLSVNWFTYIWAINAGFIVESSLGYFINPLVSVLIGVIVLHERLRTWQWAAIGLAFTGVLYLTVAYGALPWIALTLAFTFATYGLLKKQVRVGAVESMAAETAILSVPALIFLLWLAGQGQGALGHDHAAISLLLIGSGAATAIPLIFFTAAAQRIPLSLVGILQYLAPTLQFLIGVFIYHESFGRTRLIGFSLIWAALLLYTVEGLYQRRVA
jgi:chloramphenicol-sensitive protein RarD